MTEGVMACRELMVAEVEARLSEGPTRESALGRIDSALLYWQKLVAENEIQNLTRLTAPRDFVQGHLVDVLELLESGWVNGEAFDLGSGCGVPGLLAGVLTGDRWVLCDSEQKKAEFLGRVAGELGLSSIRVFGGRAEAFLNSNRGPSIIVSRAVGPVDRLMSWIGQCSTWNTLILFKGPAWAREWEEFLRGRHRRKLQIEEIREYSALSGDELRSRRLIRLKRVG